MNTTANNTITNTKRPKYKVLKNDDNFTIRVALPGVTKEKIQVASEGNQLKITADREVAVDQNWTLVSEAALDASYLLEVEVPTGYNLSEVNAKFEKNILSLTAPASQPKTLEIPLQ